MNISDNCVVAMDYTLTDNDGQVIDSSEGREPLSYLHGAGNIIPGLEKELTGKTTGDSLKVVVAPDEGYGEKNPALVQKVPREAFQGVEEIKPGMQFQAQGPQGAPQTIVVQEVAESEITVDANHPLAGVTLNFDVTIREVREASEEEVSHGHVHG
ncbi:MAG: peptidylprolyl isomerase [Kangiellaceae bacterium]|nr:peptidylprolyl isomerase [Kangiellaceae bacterium]|tara:strand:- start:4639 stop:5106 length:468 start_codon:yes stop_codon:yes gene_type:complete